MVYDRLQNLLDKVSDELYQEHKKEFDSIFEERPTYVDVIDWMNVSEGWALFIFMDTHYRVTNTSAPFYKAQFFHYGQLCQREEHFADWKECADDAINCFFTDFRS